MSAGVDDMPLDVRIAAARLQRWTEGMSFQAFERTLVRLLESGSDDELRELLRFEPVPTPTQEEEL